MVYRNAGCDGHLDRLDVALLAAWQEDGSSEPVGAPDIRAVLQGFAEDLVETICPGAAPVVRRVLSLMFGSPHDAIKRWLPCGPCEL